MKGLIEMKLTFKNLTSITVAVFAVMFIIAAGSLFETNSFGNYQIKQAAVTGDVTVRSEPGLYWQGMGTITTYPISEDLSFEDAGISVRFNDGSIAKVKGTVKFKLSLKPEKQKELHRDYASFKNVVTDLIQRNVQEALAQSAVLMVAEDSYSARRAEFSDMAKQQLERGVFKTETKNIDSVDETGTKFKKRIIEVIRDENGIPVVQKESLLKHYEIEILQFVVNDFEYDSKINELIAKKKEAEQIKIVAAAVAEKAKQDALTAEAEGSARIAQAKAEAEVKKMTEVVEAQKKTEVAKLAAQQAKYEAEKIKAQGEAEAFAAKKLVEAGLTPLEKAKIEMETKIGIAKALAGVKFPERMIISGAGSNGGTNPFEAVGLQALYELSNKIGNNGE